MKMNAKEFMAELYKGVTIDKVTYLYVQPDGFTYPYTIGQREQMLERAMCLTGTQDVYFGLHLMNDPPVFGSFRESKREPFSPCKGKL